MNKTEITYGLYAWALYKPITLNTGSLLIFYDTLEEAQKQLEFYTQQYIGKYNIRICERIFTIIILE